MANTYSLISSTTLASSAASVAFSSIPQIFTDLVLRVSARSTYVSAVQEQIWIRLNSSGSGYSGRFLIGNGTAASSAPEDRTDYWYKGIYVPASGATTSTFGSAEIYLPKYTGSDNKVMSSFAVAETNATGAYLGVEAGLWSNTSAITSISMISGFGNWASGSTFYLYGIRNS